jgi:hypothetical protein
MTALIQERNLSDLDENASGDAARRDHDDLPSGAEFWRWAGKAARPYAGWILIGLGVIMLLIGYFGVSREALVAKQIPYLVSGGIGGIVMVAVGAFFLGTDDLRKELRRLDRIERMVEQLHRVLLSSSDDDADTPAEPDSGATSANGRAAVSRRTRRASTSR